MSQFSRIKSSCIRAEDVLGYCPSEFVFGSKEWESRYDNADFLKDVNDNICKDCLLRNSCQIIKYRHFVRKNIIINYFEHDEEVIVFKKDLFCMDDVKNLSCGGGASYINIDGLLYPRDENQSYSDFLDNMARSARQSLDRFYGYALSNSWDYFFTLTTDKRKVDRFDDEEVKKLWKICREKIQTFDSNARIIICPERHENGALHFHGLCSMKRQWTMRLAFDPHTGNQLYSKNGDPLFEFPFWEFGMTTCAILRPNENPRQVANYLLSYITKQDNLGYRKKRFFHTQNLRFKEKDVLYLSPEHISSVTDSYEVYKETDKMIIYRKLT